jgi:hypothetical protein
MHYLATNNSTAMAIKVDNTGDTSQGSGAQRLGAKEEDTTIGATKQTGSLNLNSQEWKAPISNNSKTMVPVHEDKAVKANGTSESTVTTLAVAVAVAPAQERTQGKKIEDRTMA